MKPTRHFIWFCWVFSIALMMSRAAQAQAEAKPTTHGDEVMWLFDRTNFKVVGMCGNSGEFDHPTQTGIVINEAGEIIERCPDPVWASRLADELVLISSRSHEHAIPTRTLVGNGKRISINTDLRPRSLGCGWVMFDQGQSLFSPAAGRRTSHVLDASSDNDRAFFALDEHLRPIADLGKRLNIDLRHNTLVGLVEPWRLPVIQDAKSNTQQIIGRDGTPSRRSFIAVDFDHQRLRHPRYIDVFEPGHRWVYDPINDRHIMPCWYIASGGYDSGIQILKRAEGEPVMVYDDDFRQLGQLGERIQPMFATSQHILVCNDRSDPNAYRGRLPRAYRVNLDKDADESSRVTEIDISWIKSIETQVNGPVYAVRNQQDELVLIDARLDPIANLGDGVDCLRITRSGCVLVIDRQTKIYALYSAQGIRIRDFDVPAILNE